MTLDNPTGTPERALLAVGTARYDSPDLDDLPEISRSLRRVVDTLTGLGYTNVTGSPGYSVDPEIRALRSSVRKASVEAPIVVIYYTGHAATIERDTYYLLTKKSRFNDLIKTALPVRDLLQLLTHRDDNGEVLADQPTVLVILDCAYAGSAGMLMIGEAIHGSGNPNTWVIASAGPLEYVQQGLFAEAFCKTVQQPQVGASQRFLSLESIVDAVNDAHGGKLQQARLFPPAGAITGIPPFFPNPFHHPGLSSVEPLKVQSKAIDAARLIVPAITDDAIEGHPDRLGVDADARALAALVASRRLEPPLAIGLYGEWGSGKTFFMKRVQASVEDLAMSGATEVFCSGVTPVWFSAWQYADGNLWASLLHHVFASLYPHWRSVKAAKRPACGFAVAGGVGAPCLLLRSVTGWRPGWESRCVISDRWRANTVPGGSWRSCAVPGGTPHGLRDRRGF